MKKSDMVILIANHLYELNLDADDAVQHAEVILDKVLKAGMLPPAVVEETTKDQSIFDGYGKKVAFRWEDETS